MKSEKKIFLFCATIGVWLSLPFFWTNANAQTGQLSGGSLILSASNGNAVTLALPLGLANDFTLPLPSAGSGFAADRYLYDSSGVLKWGAPPTNPSSTGGVKDSVTALQTTSVNSNYLFDVSYPPDATGPLLGASLLAQSDDQDNHPTFAANEVVASNISTSASGVTVTGVNVIVADSGSGTQVGVQAEAYGLSNNYAMLFNGGNVGIGTSAPAQALEVNGNIRITGTNGLNIIEGTNATKGTVTLASGATTVTVSTSQVTANSRIFLTAGPSTTTVRPGPIWISARTAGTGFVIHSTNAPNAGVPISWMMVEPGP